MMADRPGLGKINRHLHERSRGGPRTPARKLPRISARGVSVMALALELVAAQGESRLMGNRLYLT
jgi:hypothetical protein